MRQIRFAAIAFVSLVAAIASSFIDPGTFFHRTLSFTLCSVLGLTSNLCYANLAMNSGDRAVAAFPPTEQTQNTAPTLDFSPYFQSTRPEFEGSDPTTKPETSNPPSNSSPPQPPPSAPINTPSPSDRTPEPSRLVPGSSGTSNEPCNPTLLTASAQPAKEVIVKGVPTSFTQLFAGVKVNELQVFIPTLVRRLDNGDVAIVAPLHPTKGKAGGDLQLAISSSSATCPILSLRIEPLAPAPGATNRLVAGLEQYNNKIAQSLGITQTILDNSNNPNSLKAILAGTAPILEGQRIDLELLDSLIANSGAIESIESLVKEIPKLQAKVDSSGDYKVASLAKSASGLEYLPPIASGSETPVNRQFPAKVASVDPITPALTTYLCNSEKIKTANQLSVCMKYQKEYDNFFLSNGSSPRTYVL